MVEADLALVRVLEVGPGFAGEGRDQLGELLVQRCFFESSEAGDVMVGDGGVGGVAEAGDGAQGGIGEGFGREVAFAEADGLGDAQIMSGLPGWAAWGVEASGVAVADDGVGQGVGGLAGDGVGEAGGGVAGDGTVVGDVAAAALGAMGEQGEGGGFAGAAPAWRARWSPAWKWSAAAVCSSVGFSTWVPSGQSGLGVSLGRC